MLGKIFGSKSNSANSSANSKARQNQAANYKPKHTGDAKQVASDKIDVDAKVEADVKAV